GRAPGFEKVGTERDEHVRSRKVETARLVRPGVVDHAAHASGGGEAVHQLFHRPRVLLREQNDATSTTGLPDLLDALREEALGGTPGNVRVTDARLANHRVGEPIGMVEALDRRLPARA